MKEIRGIKESKLWAVFAPDGYIQVRTISDTRKDAREKAIAHLGAWGKNLERLRSSRVHCT